MIWIKPTMGILFWRNAGLIIIAVLLMTACGNGNSKRSFPDEAKKTFETYIKDNATDIEDENGNTNSSPAYLVEWASKYPDLGNDVADGWCILMGAMVRIQGDYAYSFVVYRTKDNKWLVSSSNSDYEKAGCGN